MIEKIFNVRDDFEKQVQNVNDAASLEKLRLNFLVKKGAISLLLDELKNVPKEEKAIIGKELNQLNKFAENTYNELKEKFHCKKAVQQIDISLPGRKEYYGNLHPVRKIFDEMISVFNFMGFEVAEGPQIEDE